MLADCNDVYLSLPIFERARFIGLVKRFAFHLRGHYFLLDASAAAVRAR
jgi:hypothetical protein